MTEILEAIKKQAPTVTVNYEDISYCLKTIKSGRLYEVNINQMQSNAMDPESRNWIRTYSSQRIKRRSTEARNSIQQKLDNMSTMDRFGLNEVAQNELEKVETDQFNIFLMRKETGKQEPVVISSYLMDKSNLFSAMKIDPDTFQSFMVAIQNGYTDITYHNQTHGIDVC